MKKFRRISAFLLAIILLFGIWPMATASAANESNTAPALAESVSSVVTASIKLGDAYTLDLSTIFTDADSDLLTYTVSIDDAASVAADVNYSYTPNAAGTYTLVFTSNDSTVDSTDTFTVTLTVTALADESASNQDIQLGTDGTNLGEWAGVTLYSVEVPDTISQVTFKSNGTLSYFDTYDGGFWDDAAFSSTSYVMSLDEGSPFLADPSCSIFYDGDLQPKGVVYSETEPLYFISFWDLGYAYVIRVKDSSPAEDPVAPVTVDTDRNAFNVAGTVSTMNIYQVTAPEGTTKVCFTSPAGNYMTLSKPDGSGSILYMKEIPLKEEYRFTQAMIDATTNEIYKAAFQTLYDSVSKDDGYDYYLFMLYNNGAGLGFCYYLIRVAQPTSAEEAVLTVEDTVGNAYELTEMRTPTTLTIYGDTWPVDYVDGVYTVTVPKGTEDLRIALGDLSNVSDGEDPEAYAFFSKWEGGYWGMSSEQIWHLDFCPVNYEYVYGNPSYEGLEADGFGDFIHSVAYSDGYYTLPMEDFAIDPSNLDELQAEMYGTLDPGCDYAEVYVGTIRPGGYFDFDTLLLVKFEPSPVLTVEDTEGNSYELTEMRTPPTFTVGGTTYPVDYVDGVYSVTVPEGTQDLRIALGDLTNVPEGENSETYAFFSKWSGMLQGSSAEQVWHLDPDPVNDGYLYGIPSYAGVDADGWADYLMPTTYEDGYYTLPISDFALDPSHLNSMQAEVYGILDPDCDYAEVYVGTFRPGGYLDFDTLLLVQIGGEQHEENITPVRKVGVTAAVTEKLDDLEYSIDLSEIFEDLNGDAMTYKVKKSTDSEYTTLDSSVFNYTYAGQDVTFQFTANDGYGDGAIYKVTLTGTLLGLIRAAEAITADNSNYWTEYDFFISPTIYWRNDYSAGNDISSGYYQRMLNCLQDAKTIYDSGTTGWAADNAREDLKTALSTLMTKERVNVSLLWLAVTVAEKRLDAIGDYTEVTTGGLDTALEDAMTVYTDDLYLSAYDTGLQARIDEKANALLKELDELVGVSAYKEAYATYRDRKDEAEDLLALCDPANFHESDYTAASWQTFVTAYNALKADLEYKIAGEGGTTDDYKMVKDFAKHIDALQNARNNLVSDRDITVSFSYINNFAALYPEIRSTGTDIYSNDELQLARGTTTVYTAIQAAGLVFDKVNIYRIIDGRAIQDGVNPLLLVYVNGVNYGTFTLYALESGESVIQLHDGDEVKIVRIPTPVVKSEASSGYDTTEIYYNTTSDITLYKDSIAVISFDSLPENAKVGDKAVFTASVWGGYTTNLNEELSAENLSLYVSGPSETETFSQNLVKTTALTGEDGSLTYIFTQSGWYTVAMLNAQQEEYTFTSVYGETTSGSYGSVYAGAFALVYVAPADDEDALITAQRAENLAAAKTYYQQFHDYDFSGTGYSVFTDTYNKLVSDQNSAESFKALVDSFNADYASLINYADKNALDHAALIQALRDQLQYIPRDLSMLDYTYKNTINSIQSRYRALNDYQKTLLSKNETTRLEALLEINTANLYTPATVSITVEKDADVELPSTYGNLGSAPNENRVYVIYPDGSMGNTYYQWKTSGYGDMEPSCAGMTAYPGNQVGIRRVITQSEDTYWLVYSLDGGDTWKLMTLVDGGATSPMVMLKAEFIMPEVEGTSLTIRYKAVSQTVYEEMCLSEETPEMALEEAKAAYKAALVEVFNSYDPERYTEDDYIDIRDAKNNGLDNIDMAKEVTFAAKALSVAIEAMRAVPVKSEVHVVIRNDVYSVEDGAAWDGVLVDDWVTISSTSTMMSAIEDAVESSGYTGIGFDSGYISDINGLGEFGGGRGSGWMGTLNDWFTNEGFTQFTVASGKLVAGDLICLEYTCELGADIRGGVEGNSDTSLYELSLSGGTLTPVFDGGTVDYLLTLDDDTHATKVEFSASNRSFQTRGYLNTYTPSSSDWISTGDTIPVQSGDVIYIGVGETAWAAMGTGDATVYTIAVVDDSGAAEALIKALPDAEALTYADKAEVDRANAVYQSLSDEQKTALSADLKDKLASCIERITLLKAVSEVKASIEALPDPEDLTIADQVAVKNAKTQFDALSSDGQDDLPIISINKLKACVEKMAELVNSLDDDDIYNTTGVYLAGLGTPGVGSVGGEWLIIGLTRAGYSVPSGWAEGYYISAMTYISENMNAEGQLHASKSTDNSRMIVALTALGKDVTNVAGKNLLTALADLDYVKKQGINGSIWALIAFDSHDYTIPTLSGSGTQTTRENLIATILDDQLADGGWALSGINADPDMTAMALQALAPYYSTNAMVKAAVDKALVKLSAMQDETGGFGSWGTVNSESCAQVIVALSALGINPDTDSRFVKNGCSVVDALQTYYVDGGGFRHTLSGSRDGMASEQAYYALVAYNRLLAGETSLYDMSDVQISATDPVKDVETLIGAIGTVTIDSGDAIAAARAAYNVLTDAQKALVTNYLILTAAEARYSQLKAAADLAEIDSTAANGVIKLISAIGTVTKNSKTAISTARSAYDALTGAQKALVTNYAVLTAAETAYQKLVTPAGNTNQVTVPVEDEEAGQSPDPEDSEDTVIVTIGGVSYQVDKPTGEAMMTISELSKVDPDTVSTEEVIAAFKTFSALTAEQQAQVANQEELTALLEIVGERNHTDTATGLTVVGLDWNIQVSTALLTLDGEELATIREQAGDSTLLLALDIQLTDLLSGGDYEPDGTVTVSIPAPDMTGYDGVVILHQRSDGTMEYIEATVEGGVLTFTTSSFSIYAVVGYTGQSPLELGTEDSSGGNGWILWAAIAAALLAAFVILITVMKKRKAT